jgi:hypothetical protein
MEYGIHRRAACGFAAARSSLRLRRPSRHLKPQYNGLHYPSDYLTGDATALLELEPNSRRVARRY